MHVLVVTAHPSSTSRTQAVARAIVDDIKGAGHTAELADLAAEGFDPVFGPADWEAQNGEAPRSPEVHAEHARLDRADRLVLVYPVYWWSMPALLKGWIDRVFVSGWAFDGEEEGRIVKKLGRLGVHLVALGDGSARTYSRHGYAEAMRVQIDHGIFDFCGAPVLASHLVVPDEAGTAVDPRDTARRVAAGLTQDVPA